MKKWTITALLAVTLLALAFATHFWGALVIRFAVDNDKTVDSLKKLLEFLLAIAGIVPPVIKALFGSKEKNSNPAPTVTNSQAARDLNNAGRDVQTGGTHAERDVKVDGTLISQQTNIYQAAASAPPLTLNPLFQLPPPPADFTGRTAELAELRAAIEKGGVHISGLQGQGGVGKTALALKLAAELAPNYPDAQIYLDLKGVSDKPLTAAEAMSHVLRTFHPEAKLPEKEEDLRALYLSVLHNKRALLLMDNAKDAAQLKSLIPPPGCMFLVTSRNHFRLPGLYQKDLNTFPPDDARKFLLEIAPGIKGEAETIARLCGYLALALRLAATAIAEHADLDPADYCQRLADEKQRLKLLGGKKEEGMEASVALSYNLLDSERKKQWRILSIFPDTFDAPAATAIWETDEDLAEQALGDLVQLSMLEWNDSIKRYRLHDLMRTFARGKLDEEEREATALRHAAHYALVLASAHDLYLKGGEATMLGLALFDVDRGNIQSGQSWAASQSGRNREAAALCSDYPHRGAHILLLRQHPREMMRWSEAALNAARQLGDRLAEGRHVGDIGIAHDMLGDHRRAMGYYGERIAIAREIGDRQGEGTGLGNLGLAYSSLGDYDHAIDCYERALVIYREMHNRRAEADALGNLGTVHRNRGDCKSAINHHQRSLEINHEIRNRRGQGQDLGNLGSAYFSLGDYRRAIEHYDKQLEITREMQDHRGEGQASFNKSLALDKLGDRVKAVELAEPALKILEQIEDPNAAEVRKQLDIWKNG